jgi:hypothetical protein
LSHHKYDYDEENPTPRELFDEAFTIKVFDRAVGGAGGNEFGDGEGDGDGDDGGDGGGDGGD